MAPNVVLCQRLLDQKQVELVQPRQLLRVGKGVRGVGVHLEENLREALPDGAHGVDVMAGLDLELDAAIALRQVGADDLDELGGILMDADRDSAVDLGAYCSEVFGERGTGGSQLG